MGERYILRGLWAGIETRPFPHFQDIVKGIDGFVLDAKSQLGAIQEKGNQFFSFEPEYTLSHPYPFILVRAIEKGKTI
jgi:hypothetical protein